MPYFETSAKLNQNVDELINYMMDQVYAKMFAVGAPGADNGRDTNTVVIKKSQHGGAGDNGDDGKKKKGGCC